MSNSGRRYSKCEIIISPLLEYTDLFHPRDSKYMRTQRKILGVPYCSFHIEVENKICLQKLVRVNFFNSLNSRLEGYFMFTAIPSNFSS